MKLNIFCDFDGTITLRDTTDAALEAFALPEYKQLETLWEKGLISGRECMERQTRLIQASPEMLLSLAKRTPIDTGIYQLDDACKRNESSLFILSDGIDLLMEEVLRARQLKHIPHYSNRLVWNSDGRPSLTFPYGDPNCRGGCGLCKCKWLEPLKVGRPATVYIGDGLSDTCVVHVADRVFAKGRLREYCLKNGIPHEAFERLFDVVASLFPEACDEPNFEE